LKHPEKVTESILNIYYTGVNDEIFQILNFDISVEYKMFNCFGKSARSFAKKIRDAIQHTPQPLRGGFTARMKNSAFRM
jgi:hypothetical protein